ncbi:RNA polymerase sigma factor [Methylococcus sp. EFPC2]|uniref:RNA polymerase sigma factor n=1 Tax=Methylococcus sp. EFPC2 TaxID=2812648 RepID=UPI001967D4A1|nr:RNA polymerase sigma factor [Methylococcus sp. EFPC2]QSA96000.1 RNA polymerase sigma factor [Methylococcus sp. EFPC2]
MEYADSGVEALFLDHLEPLIRIIYRMVGCRQTAEDLAQEAYLRLIHARESDQVAYPRPFLYQTAKNLALDHLRKEKVRARTDCPDAEPELLEQAPAKTPTPEHQALVSEQVRLFGSALEALSERRRQILVLHRFHHWSYERIAQHLGLSRRAVEKNIHAALAQVLAHMAEQGG